MGCRGAGALKPDAAGYGTRVRGALRSDFLGTPNLRSSVSTSVRGMPGTAGFKVPHQLVGATQPRTSTRYPGARYRVAEHADVIETWLMLRLNFGRVAIERIPAPSQMPLPAYTVRATWSRCRRAGCLGGGSNAAIGASLAESSSRRRRGSSRGGSHAMASW